MSVICELENEMEKPARKRNVWAWDVFRSIARVRGGQWRQRGRLDLSFACLHFLCVRIARFFLGL